MVTWTQNVSTMCNYGYLRQRRASMVSW